MIIKENYLIVIDWYRLIEWVSDDRLSSINYTVSWQKPNMWGIRKLSSQQNKLTTSILLNFTAVPAKEARNLQKQREKNEALEIITTQKVLLIAWHVFITPTCKMTSWHKTASNSLLSVCKPTTSCSLSWDDSYLLPLDSKKAKCWKLSCGMFHSLPWSLQTGTCFRGHVWMKVCV